MGIFSKGSLDMEFYTTMLVISGLYFLMDYQLEKNTLFLKLLTVCGTIGSCVILLSDINGMDMKIYIDALTISSDGINAYLLLVVLLIIVNYMVLDDSRKWNKFGLVPIVLNMFVLLLHQSHISNWVLVFTMLSIASFIRPRATMMKKVGILLFVFLFLWANMSLVLNYTKWFQVGATYSLEVSVYMELFLALGGLLFFHYWDRLPKDVDLHKIGMVKMQRCFRMVTGVLGFIFLIFITGGAAWQSLPDTGMKGFVKFLAMPLSNELTAGSSTIFTWIVEMGPVIVILFLIWFYLIGKNLYKKCGIDQEKNNMFFLIYIVFLVEIFIWEIPCNVLIVFMFLISMGSVQSIKENVGVEEGGNEE